MTGDAWDFVRSAEEPYDVIVNDAFSGNRPLGPLTSDEGARTVRGHLAADGVYLANVRCACEGRRAGALADGVERLWARVSTHVGYVPEWPEEPGKPGNNVLVATERQGPVIPRGAARRTVAGEKDLSAAGPRDGRSPRCGAAPRAGRSFR